LLNHGRSARRQEGGGIVILLHIPGEPATMTAQMKGVNWRKRAFYTKSAIKAEMRRITRAVKDHIPAAPIEGPVQCSIKVRYPMTQEQAKQNAAELSNGNFELLHVRKPDADNAIKAILDTLTKCGFWTDDSQVCDLNIHKRYGTAPGIWIAIKSL
jgi:Holliday junction resolvase RusA-like endonuclease